MSQNEVDWTTHYTVYYVGYHKYDFENNSVLERVVTEQNGSREKECMNQLGLQRGEFLQHASFL